jgi:hypothetical protein
MCAAGRAGTCRWPRASYVPPSLTARRPASAPPASPPAAPSGRPPSACGRGPRGAREQVEQVEQVEEQGSRSSRSRSKGAGRCLPFVRGPHRWTARPPPHSSCALGWQTRHTPPSFHSPRTCSSCSSCASASRPPMPSSGRPNGWRAAWACTRHRRGVTGPASPHNPQRRCWIPAACTTPSMFVHRTAAWSETPPHKACCAAQLPTPAGRTPPVPTAQTAHPRAAVPAGRTPAVPALLTVPALTPPRRLLHDAALHATAPRLRQDGGADGGRGGRRSGGGGAAATGGRQRHAAGLGAEQH